MARITNEQYLESLAHPFSRPVPDPVRYTFPALLCHCPKCLTSWKKGYNAFLPIYINDKKYYYFNASAQK